MGFDLECIIDLHSYPGEYFCPVCRTLVYPNEAFQAQCTHLYCKPCLAHIANGSRACPYDGYLVTESDSKPLIESDKALAEKVGKVKVHCLYFRSGCTWEGALSDCASHGSECSFGNSPVICNRCGIQIVHRHVHDHAQICPGVYDGQQAVAGVSGVTRSGTASSTVAAVVNPTVAQSGAPVSQAQHPQNVAATPLPEQNPNQQVTASSHAAVVAPVAVPAPDQWYQQQYQQYYQQYVGYDPYQQPPQQYYPPVQQQPFQQYQQHLVQVQGQQQSHVYSQSVVQPQAPPQPQSQPPPQSQSQPQAQPQPLLQLQPQQPQQPNPVPQATQSHLQTQSQGQGQPQLQPQLQLLPQAQPQMQLPPQGQAQAHAPSQALAPNYQVNPQQQAHPAMRPLAQIPPQVLPPPPHGQASQPPQFAQATGMRPPAQHPQVPQYQQAHVQVPHLQASQAYVQPQMHPQPQPYAQSSTQSNVQIQPPQPYHSQSQASIFHPQANQSVAAATLPPAQQPPIPPASGHLSYQQPQPAQKMQSGTSLQHAVQPQPAGGSFHPGQVHGQVPQQPALMRPPSHGSFSQQQPSTLVPPQSQVPGTPFAPNQQFLPHGQQPTHPIQHRPVMQPIQPAAPQNYAQQQQFLAPYQGQLHQQGHLPQQQPSQMQMRPPGPPQPQQPQNYFGTTLIPNQVIHPQTHPLSSGGFGPLPHSGTAQLASTQTSIDQNYAKSSVLEQNATIQETKSPSKGLAEKAFEGKSLKEEVGAGQNETVVKDAHNDAEDGSVKSVIKQEKGDLEGASEQASGGKSFEARGAEEDHSLSDSVPLKQPGLENQMKLSKTAASGLSSANNEKQALSAVSASSTEGRVLPSQSYGSYQERPLAQVQGQPQGALPQPGQLVNLTEGMASNNFAGPPKSFESQSGPQGPELTTLADPRGIMGRAPPPHFEGQYGPQHVVRPSEVAMSRDQKSGSGEGGLLTKPHADGPNYLRTNGGTAPNFSSFGSRDDTLKPLSRDLFPREPTRSLDQASRSLDKPLASHDAGSKLDPGALGPHSRFLPHHPSGGPGFGDVFGPGPGFGQHHIKPFASRSPGRDYLGSPPRGFGGPSSFPRGTLTFDDSREANRFAEGSRSFNPSSDPVGNSFHDGRFPPLPGHLRRGEVDGPGNARFGEHRAPGFGEHRASGLLHNQIGTDDVFGPDGPGHLMRGKFSGPGYLASHFNMGETAGPGTFTGLARVGEGAGNFPRPPFSESVKGDSSFLHFREPGMRNNYPFHGFSNAGNFSGGMDSFDQSRKRMPVSTGWCRICQFDCETVEGLEVHSQTREHQNMALDMVRSIKMQNKKKQRTSGGHLVHEGGSRSRKVGTVGRGSKA